MTDEEAVLLQEENGAVAGRAMSVVENPASYAFGNSLLVSVPLR
jgi:hypothetical protein